MLKTGSDVCCDDDEEEEVEVDFCFGRDEAEEDEEDEDIVCMNECPAVFWWLFKLDFLRHA